MAGELNGEDKTLEGGEERGLDGLDCPESASAAMVYGLTGGLQDERASNACRKSATSLVASSRRSWRGMIRVYFAFVASAECAEEVWLGSVRSFWISEKGAAPAGCRCSPSPNKQTMGGRLSETMPIAAPNLKSIRHETNQFFGDQAFGGRL